MLANSNDLERYRDRRGEFEGEREETGDAPLLGPSDVNRHQIRKECTDLDQNRKLGTVG